MKNTHFDIPKYILKNFRSVHRYNAVDLTFGNNEPDPAKLVEGFEIYSSDGMASSKGPLKSEFYRMAITLNGTLDM